MKKKEHYVNNKDFLDALMVYRKEVKLCKEEGRDKPKVPNYIFPLKTSEPADQKKRLKLRGGRNN